MVPEIDPIEEDELCNESELNHDSRSLGKRRRIGVHQDQVIPIMMKQQSSVRKRGLSNVDQENIKNYKLNTSASLQMEFDKRIKEIRLQHKGAIKGKNKATKPQMASLQVPKVEVRGKAYLNGEKIKAKKPQKHKMRQAIDTSSSNSAGSICKDPNDLFKGFEYSVKSIQIL